MSRGGRLIVLAAFATGAFASRALAGDAGAPPNPTGGGPLPLVTPVPLLEPAPGSLAVRSWRSDRVAGALWERVRFTFCTSLGAGPFAVGVTESRGWDRHASPGAPRYTRRARFTLRLDRRYPVGVPQCRELRSSWRPERIMRLAGVRALDVTVDFPVSLGTGSPVRLTDHEVSFR